MPAKSKTTGRSRWARFWKEWGWFLILAALILIGGAVTMWRLGSRRQQEISQEAPYKVYFTQGDVGGPRSTSLEILILRDITAAKASVELATPGLDLPNLAAGLIAAKERGVAVRVLEDAPAQEAAAVLTVTERLRAAGVEVVLRKADGALGGSFLVVDESLVWAGSWDLSDRGLNKDNGLVVRWDVVQLAQDLHDEFTEMFSGGAYGPNSPADTKYKYVALPLSLSARMSVYMTPEDDPLSEILQSMNSAQHEIIVLSGGLADQRLGDRLIGASSLKTLMVWGILGTAGSSEGIVQSLLANKATFLPYHGPGDLRESFILIDGEVACIFSQAMKKDWLDQNDGYVIVLRDRNVGTLLQQEFSRLMKVTQTSP